MAEAILLVSFGGPDGPDDVMPFLENVTRGRGVPRERLLEVAEHYMHFGGRSPINDQNRELIAKLREKETLPVYWGNRNWHPLLADTLRQMKSDGITRAYLFITSAYSSYSGCRQYLENVAKAKQDTDFEQLETLKLRTYYNHPGFIEPMIDNVRQSLAKLPNARLIFTAHSIPLSMAKTSSYQAQLEEASGLVAKACNVSEFDLVWQSRSGPPAVPWLAPDILDHLRSLHQNGIREVVLTPIGFVSDHMEVLYDLDTEARELCNELGMKMVRAKTVGADDRFVAMIGDLVRERQGTSHNVCPPECCPPPARPM